MNNPTDYTKQANLQVMFRNPRIHELTRIVDLSPIETSVDQRVSQALTPSKVEQDGFRWIDSKFCWFSRTKSISSYLNAYQPKCIKELEEISKSYLQLA